MYLRFARRTMRHVGRSYGALPRLATISVAAVVASAACASGGERNAPFVFYGGARLPRDQVALLGSAHCGDGTDVRLWEIDGRRGPNRPGYGSELGGGFCVELRPGTHQLLVGYAFIPILPGKLPLNWNQPAALTFTALPGHEYVLDGVVEGSTWNPRVLEVAASGGVR